MCRNASATSSPAGRVFSGRREGGREGSGEGEREGGSWWPPSNHVLISHAEGKDQRSVYTLTFSPSLPPSLRIVDDILELFRLSSQRLQIDESVVDIHTYFMTLCDLVQVITDKNQRRLERLLDPTLPRYVS